MRDRFLRSTMMAIIAAGAVSAVMCSRASIPRIFPLFNVIFPKRVRITHESAALALELRQGWS